MEAIKIPSLYGNVTGNDTGNVTILEISCQEKDSENFLFYNVLSDCRGGFCKRDVRVFDLMEWRGVDACHFMVRAS
jgi:hypothetical protein